MNKSKFSLGLSMIVKNEHHVIERVLESVYKHIDYWVIVDTGSTDGTQDIIKKFFDAKNISGELIDTPWVDFSTCRNISLEKIEEKCDWGFWIDADEEFLVEDNFNMKDALKNCENLQTISIPTKYGVIDYSRKSIWKTGIGFKWRGPVHEVLYLEHETPGGLLSGAKVLVRAEGSSWANIQEKYANHAEILEKYTEEDKDSRWVFYTAQSHRDAGNLEKAFEWYQKRSLLTDGFEEEVFLSKYMMARLAESMQKTRAEIVQLYNDAHKADPIRGESIKSLVQYLHKLQEWETAYIYSNYGLRYNLKNPYPNRILFLDKDLYLYQMLELHSLSCFYTKRIEEGSKMYWQLRSQLTPGIITDDQMKIILNNEKFFLPLNIINPMTTYSHKYPSNARYKNSNYTPPKKKRKK